MCAWINGSLEKCKSYKSAQPPPPHRLYFLLLRVICILALSQFNKFDIIMRMNGDESFDVIS